MVPFVGCDGVLVFLERQVFVPKPQPAWQGVNDAVFICLLSVVIHFVAVDHFCKAKFFVLVHVKCHVCLLVTGCCLHD